MPTGIVHFIYIQYTIALGPSDARKRFNTAVNLLVSRAFDVTEFVVSVCNTEY